MKTILLCTLALFLTAGSCKKNAENRLPPATQTGANTFGCLINGKPFTATKPYPKGMSASVKGTVYYSVNLSHPGLYIDPTPWEDNFPIGIAINITNFKGVGIYKGSEILIVNNVATKNSFVNVTKYENGILSGVFQVEITRRNGDKFSITHGRFDIKRNN